MSTDPKKPKSGKLKLGKVTAKDLTLGAGRSNKVKGGRPGGCVAPSGACHVASH